MTTASAPSQLRRVKESGRRGANTYKFRGFNERINSIHINFHHPPSLLATAATTAHSASISPSAAASYFLTELERQRELDGSGAFAACYRQLRPLCASFALLMHNQRKIVKVLITALSDSSSSSSSFPAPYLSLLTTLTRDLRYDVYPLFPYILTSLLALINPSEPEHLQLLFSSLLYLFRFLQRQLTRDVISLHQRFFSLLLRHERWWVRGFAAEAVAYLVRRVPDGDRLAVYTAILALPAQQDSAQTQQDTKQGREEAREDEAAAEVTETSAVQRLISLSPLQLSEYRDGVASLLFHTHRNVQHGFHSITASSLSVLLSFLLPPPAASSSSAESHHHFLVLTIFFRRLANYTRREQSEVVWTALHARLRAAADVWLQLQDAKDAEHAEHRARRSVELSRLLRIIAMWTAFRRGSRIQSPPLLLSTLQLSTSAALLLHPAQSAAYQRAALNLLSAFLLTSSSSAFSHQLQSMLSSLFSLAASGQLQPQALLPLLHRLQAVDSLHPLLLRWVMQWAETTARSRDAAEPDWAGRRHWLQLLLVACGRYRQHDAFLYSERQRETEEQEAAAAPSARLQQRMPHEVVKELLRQVVDALRTQEIGEERREEIHTALQLLSLAAVGDSTGLLSSQQAEAVQQTLEEKESEEDAEEQEDEDDDALSIPHVLLAFSLHIERLLPGVPHPSSHPPLNLLSSTPPSPTTSAACTPTSRDIDQLLHLSTRAVVSSHLLSSSAAAAPSVSLLRLQHRHLLSLLASYGAHPAVLRSLLSFLLLLRQHEKRLQQLHDAVYTEQEAERLIARLSPALAHPNFSIRTLTLHILSLFPPLPSLASTASSSSPSPSSSPPLLSLLHSVSALSPTFQNETAINSHLAHLAAVVSSRRLPLPYVTLLPHFLLGLLQLKLSSVWGKVQHCLAVLMLEYGQDVDAAIMEALRTSEKQTRVMITADERQRMEQADDAGKGEDLNAEQQQQHEEDNAMDAEVTSPSSTAHQAEDGEEEDESPMSDDDAGTEEAERAGERSGDAASPPPPSLSSAFADFSHLSCSATDIYTYHSLLHRALMLPESRSFVDSRSAQLVSSFLLFFYSEFQHVYALHDSVPVTELLPADSERLTARLSSLSSASPIPAARRVAKLKLLQFLRLFDAAFSSLPHLGSFRSFLPVLLFRLLLQPDSEVQSLCLRCLAKYRLPFLLPYLPQLQRLADDSAYKEEMAAFALSPSSPACVLLPQHRLPLSAFLTRLLYPKLVQAGRKQQRGRATVGQRRAAVLSYLAGLQEDELSGLLSLMLTPFMPLLRRAAGLPLEEDEAQQAADARLRSRKEKREEDEAAVLRECMPTLPEVVPELIAAAIEGGEGEEAEVALSRQLGFLRLVEAMLAQMRSLMRVYLPPLLLVMMRMLRRANLRIDEYRRRQQARLREVAAEGDAGLQEDDVDETEEEEEEAAAQAVSDERAEQKTLRSIRQLVYSRMAAVLDLHPALFSAASSPSPDLSPYLHQFLSLSALSISLLSRENTQHRGGLLSSILVMAAHAPLLPTVMSSPLLLPAAFSLLSAVNVSAEVVKAVLTLSEQLLDRDDEGKKAEQDEKEDEERKQKAAGVAAKARGKTRRTSATIDRMMLDSSDEEAEEEEEEEAAMRTEEEETRAVAARQEAKALSSLVQAAWRQHVSCFLLHMGGYLQSSFSPSSPPRRELSIIARVSRFVCEAEAAQRLIGLLLPFLSHLSRSKQRDWGRAGRRQQGDERRLQGRDELQHSVLSVLHHTVSLHPAPASLVPTLSRQLLSVTAVANRSLLASVFSLLAAAVPWLAAVVPVLDGMTAKSSSRLDEPDYDRILAAYSLYATLMPEMQAEQHQVIVFLMLQHVQHEELAVRGVAAQTLKDLCALLSRRHSEDGKQAAERLLLSLLYPEIKRGLKHGDERIRREWLLLLRHLVLCSPSLFPSLLPLTNSNPDLDFFLNITHIQPHRRQRAVQRLRPLLVVAPPAAAAAVPESPLPPSVLLDVVLPVLNHCILASGGQGRSASLSSLSAQQRDRMRRSENNTAGGEHGLIEETVAIIALVAAALPFTSWYSVLQLYLRALKGRAELERLLVRVVCGVVEAWHFHALEAEKLTEQERGQEVDEREKKADTPQSTDAAAATATTGPQVRPLTAQQHVTADDEREEGEDVVEQEAAEDVEMDVEPVKTPRSDSAAQRRRTQALKVRRLLSSSLLPQLHSLLTGSSGGDSLTLVRPAVALAIVHLLRQLPSDLFAQHFPRIVTVLLTQLQRREQEARDVSRRVLVDVLLTVGAQHLLTVLTEARGLLARGYQRHVLSYTVYALLARLVREKAATGAVDDAVEPVMELVMDELVGELGKEKQVEAIQHQAKEAKASKALEMVEHLAELASFSQLDALLRPLRELLARTVSSEEVRRVREALRRLGSGLMRNRGLQVRELLAFVQQLITELTDAPAATAGSRRRRGRRRARNLVDNRGGADDDESDDSEDELTEEERALRLRPSKEATLSVQMRPAKPRTAASVSATLNLPVLLQFALSLLHSALKQDKLRDSGLDAATVLDPYLQLLSSTCLMMQDASTAAAPHCGRKGGAAVSDDVIDVSLRVCNQLLRLPLPSLPGFLPVLTRFLFSLLTRGKSSLSSSVFRTLSVVIHHSQQPLSAAQLSLLLSFVREELLQPHEQSVVFLLLHGILKRRFLHPELAGCMSLVAQLLVTSDSASIRSEAATNFLLYLLDYHSAQQKAGRRQLQRHLSFLLSNLSYPVVAGRLSVLSMLESVAVRFPVSVLDDWTEAMLLPLLCALCNEQEEEVRHKAAAVLGELIARLSADKQRAVLALLDQWMQRDETETEEKAEAQEEKRAVAAVRRCAAMQCYGIMLEAMGRAVEAMETKSSQSGAPGPTAGLVETMVKRMQPAVASMLQHVRAVVEAAGRKHATLMAVAEHSGEMEAEAAEAEAGDGEQEEQKTAVEQEGGEEVAAAEPESGDWRLLYFALVALEKALKQPPAVQRLSLPSLLPSSPSSLFPFLVSFLLHPHSWIRSVATRLLSAFFALQPELSSQQTQRLLKLCCLQLNTERLSEKQADLVVANLLWLTKHSILQQQQAAGGQEAKQAEEQEAERSPSRSRGSPASSLVELGKRDRGLNWAFHRLSYLARAAGSLRRLAILRFFSAAFESLPVEPLLPYLLSVLHPVFRLANTAPASSHPAAQTVKEQAAALLERLQQQVESTVFLPLYSAVRGGVLELRRGRKEKRKALAVVAPALFVRRKREKHDRKRESRKRRMQGIKLAKGIAGITRIVRETDDEQAGERRRKRQRSS